MKKTEQLNKTLLIQWYEKHGRHDLPWRTTINAYHIYLSEINATQESGEGKCRR